MKSGILNISLRNAILLYYYNHPYCDTSYDSQYLYLLVFITPHCRDLEEHTGGVESKQQ